MKDILIVFSFLSLAFLNGCASFTHMQQQAESLKQNCLKGPILITDLTKPKQNQSYQLPDGRNCENKTI